MEYRTEILHMGFVTHDVKQFIVGRPDGFEYQPGQGVEVAVDADRLREEGRPFTPTSPVDAPTLEFLIKVYPEHDAVTEELHALKPGDGLLLSKAFGAITYQGPGTFIGGGAGVTPLLAILRHIDDPADLERCTLLFSNKTPADVICERELRHLLGDRCRLTCTHRSAPGYDDRRIDRAYLQDHIADPQGTHYVCGPPDFVTDVSRALRDMGADVDGVVVEK